MWNELEIERLSDPLPCTQSYVDALNKIYVNGFARWASFEVASHRVFNYYAYRNRYYDMDFFAKFWRLPIAQAFLTSRDTDLLLAGPSVFQKTSPFLLGGSLGATLAETG